MPETMSFVRGACSYVYQIEHIASGRSYIGITSGRVQQRWSLHRTCARRGDKTPLHRALRKHGFNAFSWRVLHEVETFEEAKALEVELIAQGLGHFNATAGGDGARGMRHSPETRARMSAGAKARGQRLPPMIGTLAALRVHVGSKRTEATRARQSEAQRKRFGTTELSDADREARRLNASRAYYAANKGALLAKKAAARRARGAPVKPALEPRVKNSARWLLSIGMRQSDAALATGLSKTVVNRLAPW
jgi:hypothetical protein